MRRLPSLLWDFWCAASVVGIWPRFIEPYLIATTNLPLRIPNLPADLKGLRILQLSDLHFSSQVPDFFLNKIYRKIMASKPDLILFTGDFISFSTCDDFHRLQHFLSSLKAPLGCFATLGNHDYEQYVSLNARGDYDIEPGASVFKKSFKKLFFPQKKPTGKVTKRAKELNALGKLKDLLKKTPFELLENTTKQVKVASSYLNICGLGEYSLGKCIPEIAFKDYDRHFPGLVLLHNPDGLEKLKGYPGDIVFCGHTHGGQVNLPLLNKKFVQQENPLYLKGLWKVEDKWAYINRGVGSAFPLRWRSMPELLLLTLEGSHDKL